MVMFGRLWTIGVFGRGTMIIEEVTISMLNRKMCRAMLLFLGLFLLLLQNKAG